MSSVILSLARAAGHRRSIGTQPFVAPDQWWIRWSFDCASRPSHRGFLTLIVSFGPNRHWAAGRVLDFLLTPAASAGSGTRAERRGGTYRVFVVTPPRCAWTLQIVR